MSLSFLDRDDERRRLQRLLRGAPGQLGVVYGRRRCGKSTLLQHVCGASDVYYLADERDATLQAAALAEEIGRALPGFAEARYPSLDALLRALDARAVRLNLIIDELPYLVAVAPELPSLLQRLLDRPGDRQLSLLLCGSSQHMMQGLVLDRSAPLYGRATEILKLDPLSPGWIVDALELGGADAVESWSVWGGVPRYWELARRYDGLPEALRELVLHRNGVLHDEPTRLLMDELRSAAIASSLLALIGAGCHRMSEIAGRLGRPSGALTRPLANLIELGYVRKEVPFGEDYRSSKRTLYRLADPFMSFWFRYVQPARSLLERGLLGTVEARLRESFPQHVAEAWELLARESVPFLRLSGLEWGLASRWWGSTPQGPLEFDVVAESLDGQQVLVGEASWATRQDIPRWRADLERRAASAPFVRGRPVTTALWLREDGGEEGIVTPDQVLAVLR